MQGGIDQVAPRIGTLFHEGVRVVLEDQPDGEVGSGDLDWNDLLEVSTQEGKKICHDSFPRCRELAQPVLKARGLLPLFQTAGTAEWSDLIIRGYARTLPHHPAAELSPPLLFPAKPPKNGTGELIDMSNQLLRMGREAKGVSSLKLEAVDRVVRPVVLQDPEAAIRWIQEEGQTSLGLTILSAPVWRSLDLRGLPSWAQKRVVGPVLSEERFQGYRRMLLRADPLVVSREGMACFGAAVYEEVAASALLDDIEIRLIDRGPLCEGLGEEERIVGLLDLLATPLSVEERTRVVFILFSPTVLQKMLPDERAFAAAEWYKIFRGACSEQRLRMMSGVWHDPVWLVIKNIQERGGYYHVSIEPSREAELIDPPLIDALVDIGLQKPAMRAATMRLLWRLFDQFPPEGQIRIAAALAAVAMKDPKSFAGYEEYGPWMYLLTLLYRPLDPLVRLAIGASFEKALTHGKWGLKDAGLPAQMELVFPLLSPEGKAILKRRWSDWLEKGDKASVTKALSRSLSLHPLEMCDSRLGISVIDRLAKRLPGELWPSFSEACLALMSGNWSFASLALKPVLDHAPKIGNLQPLIAAAVERARHGDSHESENWDALKAKWVLRDISRHPSVALADKEAIPKELRE